MLHAQRPWPCIAWMAHQTLRHDARWPSRLLSLAAATVHREASGEGRRMGEFFRPNKKWIFSFPCPKLIGTFRQWPRTQRIQPSSRRARKRRCRHPGSGSRTSVCCCPNEIKTPTDSSDREGTCLSCMHARSNRGLPQVCIAVEVARTARLLLFCTRTSQGGYAAEHQAGAAGGGHVVPAKTRSTEPC